MSTNLKNRSIALGATFALLASGFVATAPAAYAATAVGLAPTTGTNLGAMITDDFSMNITVPQNLSPANTAIKIDNPDQEELLIGVTFAGANTATGFTIRGYNALGGEISSVADREFIASVASVNIAKVVENGVEETQISAATTRTAVRFDNSTDDNDITSLVISDIVDKLGPVNVRTITLTITLLDGTGGFRTYGEKDGGNITVTAWNEVQAVANYNSVDSSTASAAATVKYYDPAGVSIIPRIERFVEDTALIKNDVMTTNNFGASVQFSKSDLNLDQLDISKFQSEIKRDGATTSGVVFRALTAPVLIAGTKKLDDASRLYVKLDASVNVASLATEREYVVSIRHTGTNAPAYGSVGVVLPKSPNATVGSIEATVTDKVNAIQTNAADTNIQLRAGTSAFTYTAQVLNAGTGVALRAASVPVVAVVQAGSYLSTGGGYTVSGATESISSASGATIATGFTGSDGKFSVTVTSTNADKNEDYTVKFFAVLSTGALSAAGSYTAAYESGSGTVIKPAATVLSGTSVTASFSVTDQFGQATNLNGGKALSIGLEGSNIVNLDEDAKVAADGTVSFTFPNYVASGSSDVLTAQLYTGAATSPSVKTSTTLSLYNPAAVSAVQVPAALSGNITYDDFITGKSTTAAPAPDDNTMSVTGTAVDANGTGVPGAVVTISADGFQFVNSGGSSYFQDSITVSASASGVFTVNMWSHIVDTAGAAVTVTSGGQTATTTVKTYLPGTKLDGRNLSFSLDVPANIVMNTTYAVTATLTDKWGNPVQTSGTGASAGVAILGVGSLQVNSSDTAVEKNFGKDGKTTVFLRSVKDIPGPGSVTATLRAANYSATSSATATALAIVEQSTDVKTTAWNETLFSNELEVNVEVVTSAAGLPASTDTKVNAGSFKGYVAVYAKGHEGKRLSAKIGNDWVIVPSLASSFERITDFTGAGVDISVRIYIDRVLLDTIELTTK